MIDEAAVAAALIFKDEIKSVETLEAIAKVVQEAIARLLKDSDLVSK